MPQISRAGDILHWNIIRNIKRYLSLSLSSSTSKVSAFYENLFVTYILFAKSEGPCAGGTALDRRTKQRRGKRD